MELNILINSLLKESNTNVVFSMRFISTFSIVQKKLQETQAYIHNCDLFQQYSQIFIQLKKQQGGFWGLLANQFINFFKIAQFVILNMKDSVQIIKSPSDSRQYKAIQLQNGLECLLIRDTDALKSSAALSMGVGSFKDPSNANGLAHYLEHMLFMGTTKYPDENDYSKFITKNGGKNNAYTSQQQTNYMFQVSSQQFEGALDRFAQFFISPLLKQQSAQKQIQAVNSEHQKNLLNDAWRNYQLSKHLSKTGHPFNKFSTGDKTTLMQQNLQQMLKNFYNQNYSSNLMKLVIYDKQQLAILEKWARQKFSSVPNKQLKKYQLGEQPFDDKSLGKLIKYVPIKDSKKLHLTWILPNKREYYRNHPGSYISNLIGHEGKGSLLSFFMKEGLATSLSSGNYDNYDCYTEFSVDIGLTDKGLTKIQQIICYVMYYIKMLKENGCPEWFFKQLQLINKLKFQFMDKKKGMDFTANLSKNMHKRKIQQILVQPYLMEQWKPQTINQYLREMTAQNLIVFCCAKQFESECTETEPVYKTKYSSSKLKILQPLQCTVSLPEENIFLPKDLTVLPLKQEKLPVLIYETDFLDVFFKQDHTFGLPKANINLRLTFDGNFTVIQQIARQIFLEMIKEHLREFRYLAQMAEIQVESNFVSYFALDLKFKGFRDSLKLFIVQYLNRIFEFIPTDVDLFNTLVEKNRRKYSNAFLIDPYNLVYKKSTQALRNNFSVSDDQKVIQIQNIKFEDVVRLSKNWKNRLFIESYFTGNITEQQSKKIAEQMQKFLLAHSKPQPRQQTGLIRSVCLPSQKITIIEEKLKNKQEQNSALEVHYQFEQLTVRNELLLSLLETIAKQPAFDYLRTQQKLGYVVFCMAEDNRGVGGISIIVQSQLKSSYQIETFVSIFFKEKLKQLIQKLTEEQFNTYKAALLAQKKQKDKNLNAQTLRYWSQIVKHKYLFNRNKLQVEIIPQLTLAQLKQFIQKNLYENPRILQVHMTSCKKQIQDANTVAKSKKISQCKEKHGANVQIYQNTESFWRKTMLFPDFYAPNPKQNKTV